LGSVKNLKGQKLSKEVLPILFSGSPGKSKGRTFTIVFHFLSESKNPSELKKLIEILSIWPKNIKN